MRFQIKEEMYKIQIPVKIFGVTVLWRNWTCALHETTGGDGWPLVHYLNNNVILFRNIDEARTVYKHSQSGMTYKGHKIEPIIERDRFSGWRLAYTVIKLCKKERTQGIGTFFWRFAWYPSINEAKAAVDAVLRPNPKWVTVNAARN